MDSRKTAFKIIEKHCKMNKKGDIIFYLSYAVYKRTFSNILNPKGKGKTPSISSEVEFQTLKESHLADEHIKQYVKQAEEILEDTLKIVQKNNWWREFWFAIGTNILANLIYWGLAFIFFLVFKDQVANLLDGLSNNGGSGNNEQLINLIKDLTNLLKNGKLP